MLDILTNTFYQTQTKGIEFEQMELYIYMLN